MIPEVRKGILFEDFQVYPGMGGGGMVLCYLEKCPLELRPRLGCGWGTGLFQAEGMAWVKAGRQATGNGLGRKTGTGPCMYWGFMK